jgi:hypothetical protein
MSAVNRVMSCHQAIQENHRHKPEGIMRIPEAIPFFKFAG